MLAWGAGPISFAHVAAGCSRFPMPWRGWRWAAHSQPVEVAPIPGVDAAMWRSVFFTGIPPFTTSLVESGSFFEGMECAKLM